MSTRKIKSGLELKPSIETTKTNLIRNFIRLIYVVYVTICLCFFFFFLKKNYTPHVIKKEKKESIYQQLLSRIHKGIKPIIKKYKTDYIMKLYLIKYHSKNMSILFKY